MFELSLKFAYLFFLFHVYTIGIYLVMSKSFLMSIIDSTTDYCTNKCLKIITKQVLELNQQISIITLNDLITNLKIKEAIEFC